MKNIYITMDDTTITSGAYDHITSIKQIKQADKAYIYCFKKPSNYGYSRFTVYTQRGAETLETLTFGLDPAENGLFSTTRYLLLQQVLYTGVAKYPPIHFCLRGSSYEKNRDIATALKQINPALKVYDLSELGIAYEL